MDGRYEAAYPESTFALNNSFFDHDADWTNLCRSYKVDFVILDLMHDRLQPEDLMAQGYVLIWKPANVSALLCLPEHAAVLQQTVRNLPNFTIDPLNLRTRPGVALFTDGSHAAMSKESVHLTARRGYWSGFAFVAAVFLATGHADLAQMAGHLGGFLACNSAMSRGNSPPGRCSIKLTLPYLRAGPLSQYYHAFLFQIFWDCIPDPCPFKSADYRGSSAGDLSLLLSVGQRDHRRRFRPGGGDDVCPSLTTRPRESSITSLLIVRRLFMGWCSRSSPWRFLRLGCSRKDFGLAMAAGFCGGLAFLTKPEVFLALAISLGAGLLLFWRVKQKTGFLVRSIEVMAVAFLVPLLAFGVYFWIVMDFQQAWRDVCGGWIAVLAAAPRTVNTFAGAWDWTRPPSICNECSCNVLASPPLLPSVSWVWFRPVAPKGLAFVVAVGLGALAMKFNWVDSGQGLPVICLVTLGLLLRRAKGIRLGADGWCFQFYGVFSVLRKLLFKLGLFSRIWHYGFVLGMPGFLCGIYLLLWLLPRELERFQVRPALLRCVLCLPLLVGLGKLTSHSLRAYAWKTVPIGQGADEMRTFNLQFRPEGVGAAMALRWLETNAPPQATLAVLPTGVMINYLSRRTNPTRYPVWAPPEMAAFGQQKMTDDFIKHSPDYVILVGMRFDEFGEKYFGEETRFGGYLVKWINANYQPKLLIGDDWLQTGQFGIRILQKAPAQGLSGPRG